SKFVDALANADPQARIEAVAPNLEDVFVAATRGRGREPAA
ncbi:ABC transporter ATP-binding protein, partial [Stenotrophomonas maltophilia]